MRTILASAVVLLAASAAFAADRKVAPGESIQAAVDAASSGDRILLGPGTYAERVFVPHGTNGLQFIGRSSVWEGFDGMDVGPCLTLGDVDDVVVKGISFRNATGCVVGEGERVVVTKCSFRNSSEVAVSIAGDGTRVESCRFVGTTSAVALLGTQTVFRRNDVRNTAGSAVSVEGNDALVEANVLRTAGWGWGVLVTGRGPRILKNLVANADLGIYAAGNHARIEGNRCTQIRMLGILAQGDDAIVQFNRVQGTGDSGIRVTGDRFGIARNTVTDVLGDVDGILAMSASESGGGTIDANLVSDTGGFGLFAYGVSIEVTGNLATNCGILDGGGMLLVGRGNRLDANLSYECSDTAFEVHGDSNVLTRNVARDATGDGFQVEGAGNRLDGNTALRCGGEGLHNAGTATDVTRGKFSGNRIDVACDQGQGAYFDEFRDNSYVTGGEDRSPEIDFPGPIKLLP